MDRLLRMTATGIALGALWSAVGVASEAAPQGTETELPQAAHRIFDWAIDGDKGMWVQSMDKQWYYAAFLSPCYGAVPDNITFRFNNANGSLDRFSHVIVHRMLHSREICAFKSFSVSAGPPEGVLHKVPLPHRQ